MSNSLPGLAYTIVDKVEKNGIAHGHSENGWKKETPWFHYTKAAKHLMTHIGETTRVWDKSGENHAELALCRIAMALWVEKKNAEIDM